METNNNSNSGNLVNDNNNLNTTAISNTNDSKKNIDSNYMSCELLLEHLAKEYDKEDSRSMKIDSRIPIFITIATFFAGLIFSSTGNLIKETYKLGVQIYSIYIVIYSLCILSLISSIGSFIWILCTKKYMRINTDLLLQQKAIKENVKKTAFELMKAYNQALKNNININDKKMKYYNLGIILLIISSILYLILCFVNFFIY